MKLRTCAFATLAAALLPATLFAQTPSLSCRPLDPGNTYIEPDEKVIGNQACKIVSTSVTAPKSTPQEAPANAAPSSAPDAAPAQAPRPVPDPPPAEQPAQNPPNNSPQVPRVFLQSASHGNNWNARRDQSMEMAKDFEKVCPGVKVTINQQNADYTVILNHIEVGLFARDNQVQVADKSGDLLKTKEGGGIKGSVKNACTLILADWGKH